MADTIAASLRRLRQSLDRYPERVRAKLAPAVDAAADGLVRELEGAYPAGPTAAGTRKRKSGSVIDRKRSLKYGIRTGRTRDGLGRFVVTSAPHAHLYEYGTRRRSTARGANRGSMPGKRTFIPAAAAARRALVARAEAIVAAEPLEDPGA